ncbi:hypothetical protein LTR91_023815 [Friedmanniomyces endolithicus]|uniref:N-acetyltransferase domain-containing protein n=1 Tax=Friedmanniomyces endolithicus TaxID=329885 RepID=A0AAN6H888_9PEZI|nr:hypothetical protein LTR94_014287 [Friedmanniomyces endolithicus]KAK0777207.1 hypothetical protein LTR59_013932 [Friedmanniomyces endolithicus]KAK0797345.1 hypothetical protein LTR38_008248 [Friedmanniomyces endolithicus]KAK0813957.1 hypothetical protein LTR75_004412 [Friedmanniomyces endolithicus]KAK0837746.1 hypothetical protein LTR03_012552 [Friedmanniomyces endolithicus]
MRTRSQRVDSAQPEQQHADGAVTRARKRASQDHDAPLQDVPLQEELLQDDEADAAPIDDARFLSDWEEVNNRHLRGTLTIIFEDIRDNADTPWQILRPHIVFQAEGAAETQEIGYLNLTFVHTTTFGRGKPWIRGLLRTALAKNDTLKTVSDALRLLWDTSGRLRKDARKFSDVLNSKTIAYVCTIFLEEAWRNKGLGPAAMKILHRILPAHLDHANVTMLLQPSMLDGDSSPEAGEIQRALIRFYGQSGYQKGIRRHA